MLVLIGMNYENKVTLYEEVKKFLKKFMGEGGYISCDSKSIKLEFVFLVENEEVLLVVGYVRRGGNSGYRRSGRFNSRGGGRGLGFFLL